MPKQAPTSLFERFELLGSLGQGGMGSVSLAYDSQLHARVALKSVGAVAGATLLRFKREFRAVKGLAHPNLVSLGELFEQDGRWYLSMEYIDGVSFLDYVRPLGSQSERAEVSAAPPFPATVSGPHGQGLTTTSPGNPTLETLNSEDVVNDLFQVGGNGALRFDEGRLRHCLLQLVEATHVLHERGRAHRDLKPSNVLVTPRGRVVMLDFGLITEADRPPDQSTGAFGTPAYMAPEQARGRGQGSAVDRYALGVMLYEALCGRWPVVGSIMALLRRKQEPVSRRPSEFTDQTLPDDLEQLCMDMLALDPNDRPTTPELFERLGAEQPQTRTRKHEHSSQSPCIGRESQLEPLERLFAQTRAKRPSHALITGEAGIGKTSLIREALARFSTQVAVAPWVLYGRCHEHEQVRYKAFDSLVDRLSVELPERFATPALRALLPEDAYLLARAFPVLQRITAFAEVGLGPPSTGARDELQRRMRVAFRELLFRLAERTLMVLVVEDLQWADASSWALLEELVGATDAPPLALLTSARAEFASTSWASAQAFLAVETLTRIELGPLGLDSVGKLAALHRRLDPATDASAIERLAATSGGHPLYLDLLLRSPTLASEDTSLPSLSDCLRERARKLDPAQRTVLEALAVSDRAMTPPALASITGLDGEQIRASLEGLRSEQWVRGGSGSETGQVSVFHSQVREAVTAWMPEAHKRAVHLALAEQLEARGDALDRVVEHLLAGHARERALALAARAAEAAMNAMAFEHAARLYALALEDPPRQREQARALEIDRARALAWGGRRLEAAGLYLDAAEGAPTQLCLELRSNAALHLMSSGEFTRAEPIMRAIMRELGVSLPRSAGLTMMALVRDTVVLRLTTRRVRIDADIRLGPKQQLRLALCQAGHWVHTAYDLLLTGYFSTTYARLALRTREPSKVASGLSHVAGFVAYMGDFERAEAMFDQAEVLLDGLDVPLIRGTIAIHRAVAALYSDYDCLEYAHMCTRGLALLREAGRAERGDDLGVVVRSAAMVLVHMVLAQALERAGDLRGLEALWRELSTNANKLDSDHALQTWVLISPPFTTMHLSRGRVTHSLAVAQRGLALLDSDRFLVPHLVSLISRVRCAIYQGEPAKAVADLEHHRPHLERSFTVRAPDLRAEVAAIEASARLALRAHAGAQTRSDRELHRALRFLESFPAAYQRGRGQALRACLMAQEGQSEPAATRLLDAIATFEGCSSLANAAAVKLLVSRLRNDEQARNLRSEGLHYFLDQDVHDPERFADTLFPGCIVPEALRSQAHST